MFQQFTRAEYHYGSIKIGEGRILVDLYQIDCVSDVKGSEGLLKELGFGVMNAKTVITMKSAGTDSPVLHLVKQPFKNVLDTMTAIGLTVEANKSEFLTG